MRAASARLSLATRILAIAAIAGFTFTATAADAKPRKRTSIERSKDRSKVATKPRRATEARATSTEDGSRWRYGSSAIMVDGNTGKVLYEDEADALRHPASVTKVMTLYLLFEQLQAGRLKLDSKLEVSAKAASQSPSKLNVRAGSSIEVEDAIKALVTRSANDVAVVIAEGVGGTESDFAEMMTDKARALGMSRTTFRNASGLPNPNQVTTARDLSILGRAIQDRFPKEYKYFATRTFYYRGEAIGNHNRLLGRVEGVDGIKTGYTQASGYNLLTSVKRDGRYLVGVVLGGRSGGARDARMASLVSGNLERAYAGGRTAPPIVETAQREPSSREVMTAAEPRNVAPLPKPQAIALAAAAPAQPAAPANARNAKAAVAAGSTDPIKPNAVRTVAIQRPVAASAASAGGAPANARTASAETSVANVATGFTTPAGVLGYLGPSGEAMPNAVTSAGLADVRAEGRQRSASGKDEARHTASRTPAAPAVSAGLSPAERAAQIAAMDVDVPAQTASASSRPVRTASLAPVAAPAAAPAAASARGGWQIQIGAFDAESAAKARLDKARDKAGSVLNKATPFTEKVSKGSSALYRARFAGLDEKGAQDACRLLKRNAIACITIRN